MMKLSVFQRPRMVAPEDPATPPAGSGATMEPRARRALLETQREHALDALVDVTFQLAQLDAIATLTERLADRLVVRHDSSAGGVDKEGSRS